MGAGSLTASNWTVSTRQDGEVLAIWAGSDQLQLGVFATREGFSPAELEGWLRDLISVASESARQDVDAREIPAILHHALTGLLFSHAELWEREGGMYFSMALVTVEGLVGVGWVGDADIQVHVENIPQEVDWVVVRDSEGREARAATFDATLPLRYWVSWNPGMDEASGVAVDAEWNPESDDSGGIESVHRGARLVELTAEDLAPVTDEIETEPEAIAANEVEIEAGPEIPAKPEVVAESEFEREPQDLDEVERASEPESRNAGDAAGLPHDIVRQREFTPPANRPPSAIREAFDLDRLGVAPFEDALEMAPETARSEDLASEAEIGLAESASDPAAQAAPHEVATNEVATDEAATDEAATEAVSEPAQALATEASAEPDPEWSAQAADELDPAWSAEAADEPASGLAADALAEWDVAGVSAELGAEPVSGLAADALAEWDAAGVSAESGAEPVLEFAPDAPAEPDAAVSAEVAAPPVIEVEPGSQREWTAPPNDLTLEHAAFEGVPAEAGTGELEAAPRRVRRVGMWERISSLWRKRPKRVPDLNFEESESEQGAGEMTPRAAEPAIPQRLRAAAPPSAPAAAEPAPTEPPEESPRLAPRPAPRPVPRPAPRTESLEAPPLAPGLVRRSGADVKQQDAPTGEPMVLPRAEAVAPQEAPIEQRPARLSPLPLGTPVSKPGVPERAKPATLPEERLAPLVRTSPARPSLRVAPAPLSESGTWAHEHETAAPEPPRVADSHAAPRAAPRAGDLDPDLPQYIPPPELLEPETEVVREAASEPKATAEPVAEQLVAELAEAVVAELEKTAAPPAAAIHAPAPRPEAPVAARARAAVVRAPIRAQWPTEEEMTSPLVHWARAVLGVVLVGALFAAGWLLGGFVPEGGTATHRPNLMLQLLQSFSLAAGRYHVSVETEPDGASIAVDGRVLAKLTPAVIDLKPGAHQVTLSYPDLGSATFGVRGRRDQNVTLHEALWGRLSVEQDTPDVPVSVSVDGRDLGFVPVTLDSVAPGAHDVRFSGPNMTPWAQTVAVKVRESARIVAHPMVSPATGVLSIRATRNDEQGSAPLAGGEVWLDGELIGRTPLTLELPRGPHSVKVVYGQQAAPVQVIDLPGGNQRFATFQLGAGSPDVRLTPVSVVSKVLADQPALVSAGLNGVGLSDVREMWLHVRGPDDNWQRYALNVLKTPDGVVGVATFPLGDFDDKGLTKYYLSALLITGDEYFTEIANAQLVAAPHQPATK